MWMTSLRCPDGGWQMHLDGECDVRGAYCAAAVTKLTNTMVPGLFEHTTSWIASCQTYDGGVSAVPGAEAHGGYAFCGLAAAVLLEGTGELDLQSLLHWASNRQMKLGTFLLFALYICGIRNFSLAGLALFTEGGFQGRPNKLVDGCYSFWVGGVFPLLSELLHIDEIKSLFHRNALEDYILLCGQADGGGLRDKPGKGRDYYHTCYCLSGLSMSKAKDREGLPVLRATHLLYNICRDKVAAAEAYYGKLQAVTRASTSSILG